MSTPRDDIDFPRSQAILLATSAYTAGFGCAPMPAASNSLAAMRDVLQGPCGWPASRVQVFADKGTRDFVLQDIAALIHDTTDVLLFYYVGHGQLLAGNDLGLALTDSSEDPRMRLSTSLRLSQLRQEMELNCTARIKILILDCCSSGIATKYAQGAQNLAAQVHKAAELEGEGTYTWTACGHSQDTYFEPGLSGLTYFTKFLTETVRHGIRGEAAGLTVAALHRQVKARLRQTSLPNVPVTPEPTLLFHGPADAFVFARNLAPAGSAPPRRDLPPALALTVPRPADAEPAITDPIAQVNALQHVGEMLNGPIPPSRSVLADAERLALRVTRRSPRETMLGSIAEKLAAQDPAAARRVADLIKSWDKRKPVLQTIARVLATRDMRQAQELLAEIALLDDKESNR